MDRQRTQRFKELRADKRLSNVSDKRLYENYMDDLDDENAAREHVLSTNKKLAKELEVTKTDYDNAMRKMYDSVKDKTLNKIKLNKKGKRRL